MTSNDQPEITVEAEETEDAAVQGGFGFLLTGEDIDESVVPASPLEKSLAKVDKAKEQLARTPAEAHFHFRDQLTSSQLAELRENAPKLAERFIGDVNQVMNFGGGVMDKLKATSRSMLEAQKAVEIPAADQIINDLLRELDGFEKKYSNARLDELSKRFFGLFKNVKYAATTMKREMQPLEDKLDMTEVKLEGMDGQLADNVARGQLLHKQTLAQMNDVSRVLASLEEIIENIRGKYRAVDALLTESMAAGKELVEYEGRTISISELQEIHANLSMVLTETEKSWYDWRQQFFLGWANAPATRNLVVSTVALRRRLRVFKDMGIQSGRQALVTWKQAIEARQGAELGAKVQSATDKMVQSAYKEVADTTKLIAEASQAPLISEETVISVIESVRSQARSIVEADRNGRVLRAKNLQALERGEVQIKDEVIAMQMQLADNARKDRTLEGGSATGAQKAVSAGDSTDDFLNNLSNS